MLEASAEESQEVMGAFAEEGLVFQRILLSLQRCFAP